MFGVHEFDKNSIYFSLTFCAGFIHQKQQCRLNPKHSSPHFNLIQTWLWETMNGFHMRLSSGGEKTKGNQILKVTMNTIKLQNFMWLVRLWRITENQSCQQMKRIKDAKCILWKQREQNHEFCEMMKFGMQGQWCTFTLQWKLKVVI